MKKPIPYYELGLEHDQLHTICRILNNEFEHTQYERAALELRAAGITSKQLHAFGKTAHGMYTPDPWKENTYNELRNLEIKDEESNKVRGRRRHSV